MKERLDFLTMPPTDISSTAIRDRIDRGFSVAQWVPPKVLQYVEENRLYRS
jgi:nicotinic acid mononucleotide adenylyltransferase